jgi:hypothetical protein
MRWRMRDGDLNVGSRVRVRGSDASAVLQQSLDMVIALLSGRCSPSMRRVSWVLFGWYGGVGCWGWLHALEGSKGRRNFYTRRGQVTVKTTTVR